MKRILALALLLASACLGAQTTISDNVASVGNIVRDSIVSASVSWNSFTAADSTAVTAGSQTVTIAADGSFSLPLSPNAGTTGVYTVIYTGKDGRTFIDTLNVPVSGSAVTLSGARLQGAVLRASDGNQFLMPGVAPVYSSSSGGSTPTGVNPVSFSSTPAFDLSKGDQAITLTGNVSASSFSGLVKGEALFVQVCQDATGGWAFAWPTGFHGGIVISSAQNTANPNTCAVQEFKSFDGSSLYAVAPGVVNE